MIVVVLIVVAAGNKVNSETLQKLLQIAELFFLILAEEICHRRRQEVELNLCYYLPMVIQINRGEGQGGFGKPEDNLKKHLARSQGSKAGLNSLKHSQGEA